MADVSGINPPQVGGIYMLVDVRDRTRVDHYGCCGCEFEYLDKPDKRFVMTPKAQSTRPGCSNKYCGYPCIVLDWKLTRNVPYDNLVLVEVSVPAMVITGRVKVIGEL